MDRSIIRAFREQHTFCRKSSAASENWCPIISGLLYLYNASDFARNWLNVKNVACTQRGIKQELKLFRLLHVYMHGNTFIRSMVSYFALSLQILHGVSGTTDYSVVTPYPQLDLLTVWNGHHHCGLSIIITIFLLTYAIAGIVGVKECTFYECKRGEAVGGNIGRVTVWREIFMRQNFLVIFVI